MIAGKSIALFAIFGLLAVADAGAQQITYPPGQGPGSSGAAAPAPEAPDGGYGMALMSATVASDGTLLVGSGVVSSTLVTTGSYNIAFVRGLEQCTCTASFGGRNFAISTTAQNYISANCPFGAETVRVNTNVSGTAENFPFHLIVYCPR